MTRLPVLAVALLLAVVPARAGAADADRESRRHFQAGETHFKAGAFQQALAEYQAGYEAKPLPGFLVNIAQCQRRLGDLKAARANYQKFVMVAPDSPLVPQAKAMVEELDKLLAEIAESESSAEPSTKTEAPDVAAEVPAAAEPVKPAPETLLVAQPTPAPEPPAPARRRWWLWGTLGAVVVGGAVTAIVLSTGGTTTLQDGSLGTLRR